MKVSNPGICDDRPPTMRRLKVMHIVHGLQTGGMENGVVNLCNRLDPARFELSICAFEPGGALEARLDVSRVKLLAVRRRVGNDPTVPIRLAWTFWRTRPDIVHTHCWVTLVEGYLAARMAGIASVIHSEHGIMEERPRNVRVQRWLWHRAAQVTAVSAPLAERMASVVGFSRDRIQVIPNGVDTESFRPLEINDSQLRQRLGLPAEGFLIGMVARLVPVKNHAGVFHALARLRERNIEADLVLAGDGPLRTALQRLAEDLHIQEHVHFLGDVAHVGHLLNSLDVFVLNSHSEGMSNTILEAMACGIPVVATSVGSNSTLVAEGESGCLTPPDNYDALAQALAKLAEQQVLRRSMGKAARLRIEKHFGITSMVEAYRQLYEREKRRSTIGRHASRNQTHGV